MNSQATATEAIERLRRATASLDEDWSRIRQNEAATSAAAELRDAGLQEQFWSQALNDLADTKNVATTAIRRIAVWMVEGLHVPVRQVAEVLDVSPSTISDWRNQAKRDAAK